MGLWDAIKGKGAPPISIANPDVKEEIDPVPGAPINGAHTPGLKFKPVEPVSDYMDLVVGDLMSSDTDSVEIIAEFTTQPKRRNLREEYAAQRLAAGLPPPDKGGRPRVYATNAERQKKYRERQKAKKQ